MSTYGGWGQEEDEEEVVRQLARLLKTRAWLVGGRDDAAVEAVYRHRGALREVLAAVGCTLALEADLVRVYNPAPPLSARLPEGVVRSGCGSGSRSVRWSRCRPGSDWGRWPRRRGPARPRSSCR
ncbi:hypothetical protein [Streptomyces sp. NPDC056921]|uniref:hypothetical protein n=1 Tax=Streptomyces sp. NPDC056921 TaxID=3345966 RepID=UPI00363FCEAD